MPITEFFKNLTAGSLVAVIVLVLSFIEIVPIKISPLQWIGRRLNKETLRKVGEIERKLDEHVAQSYRTKILNFQDDILNNDNKTREQWKEVINAISAYETYCSENTINNGLCKEASAFLVEEYRKHLVARDFDTDEED